MYIEKAFLVAQILNISIIRIFSYVTGLDEKQRLVNDELFLKVLEASQRQKRIIAVENEPICTLKTVEDMKWYLDTFADYTPSIWFDVSNFIRVGSSINENAFRLLAPSTAYVQLKDFNISNNYEYVTLLTGDVPYKDIIPLLERYIPVKVPINIETHIPKDKEQHIRDSYQNLRKHLVRQ